MFFEAMPKAIKAWEKTYPGRNKVYYLSVEDTEEWQLSDDPNNTIGSEEADAAEGYNSTNVMDLLGAKHSSIGIVLGNEEGKVCLLLSRTLSLVEITSVNMAAVSFQEYIKKGIDKSYRQMPLLGYLMSPTIGDFAKLFGPQVKKVIGSYMQSLPTK